MTTLKDAPTSERNTWESEHYLSANVVYVTFSLACGKFLNHVYNISLTSCMLLFLFCLLSDCNLAFVICNSLATVIHWSDKYSATVDKNCRVTGPIVNRKYYKYGTNKPGADRGCKGGRAPILKMENDFSTYFACR